MVTGSSCGIGAAIVREFSSDKDMNIVINYNKSKEKALSLLEELRAKKCQVIAIKADISKPLEAQNLIESALNEFGKIDILVNNAGISTHGLITETSNELWEKIFSINVHGMFYCTKAAVIDMLKRHFGKIINVSSVWGMTGASCEVPYSSSKAAVIGFTKSLAKELGPSNINVNCIAPGVIKTDMNEFLNEDELNELKEITPLGRIGSPEEVAKTVKFLSSSDSDFITGQVISPNGGFLI